MHPYNSHKSNLLGVASGLWSHGFSVFMFDFRSFSKIPNNQSIGYFEQFDAIAAINYVLNNYWQESEIANDSSQNKPKQLVLMGASMGGACAILASKQFNDHQPTDDDNYRKQPISAIVTDCSFSSLYAVCKYRLVGIAWLPIFLIDPVLYIMDIGNQYIYGYSIHDVDPCSVVSDECFRTPLLLIHSECDTGVPLSHSQRLYNECSHDSKNLFIVKSSNHCGGYFLSPQYFVRQMCAWVDNVLDAELENISMGKNENVNFKNKNLIITDSVVSEMHPRNTNDDIIDIKHQMRLRNNWRFWNWVKNKVMELV